MSIDSVQDITPRVQYTSSASQTVFAYPFPIFENEDLVVIVDEILQALDTDYTVSGAGDDAGGNVTFLAGQTAGAIVTIYRDIAIQRLTDMQQNGPWTSASINDELDRLTLVDQQLESRIGRAVRTPIDDSVSDADMILPAAADRANKYPVFGSSGQLEVATSLPTGTLSSSAIGQALDSLVRTAAEIAAGVTPTNYAYAPGDVLRYGADPTGVADSTTAIQAACDQAAQTGGVPPFARAGTFLLDGSPKLVIKTSCDFSAATFNIDNAPAIAIEVSTGSAANPTDFLWNVDVYLPTVVNLDKPATGWAGQGTGVRLVNVQNSRVYCKRITGFNVGLYLAAYSQGCAYNRISIENQYNNKINICCAPGNTTGYVNENNFDGGACAHISGEGTNVASTRHILLQHFASGNIVNNNRFNGLSLEGDVAEYHVEDQGIYNHYKNCRWEATSPKVYFNATAMGSSIEGSTIEGGYGLTAIATTFAGTVAVKIGGIARRNGQCFADQGFSWSNLNSDTARIVSIYPSTVTEPWEKSASATDWTWQWNGRELIGKRTGDAEASPRVKLDALDGIVYVNGGVLWRSGTGNPEGVYTAPVGSLFSRTDGGAGTSLYIKQSGSGNTGWAAVTP